jgi:hypothetical protein
VTWPIVLLLLRFFSRYAASGDDMRRVAIAGFVCIVLGVALWRLNVWFHANYDWWNVDTPTTVEELPPFCVEATDPMFDERIPGIVGPRVQFTEGEELGDGAWVLRGRLIRDEDREMAQYIRPEWGTRHAITSIWTQPAEKGKVLSLTSDPGANRSKTRGGYTYALTFTGGGTSGATNVPRYFMLFSPRYRVQIHFWRDDRPIAGRIQIGGSGYYSDPAWYGNDVFVLRVDRPAHKVFCVLRYAKLASMQ